MNLLLDIQRHFSLRHGVTPSDLGIHLDDGYRSFYIGQIVFWTDASFSGDDDMALDVSMEIATVIRIVIFAMTISKNAFMPVIMLFARFCPRRCTQDTQRCGE